MSLVLVFSFSIISFVNAEDVRTIEKNFPIVGGRFLLFKDNSCWVIYPVAKKSRSFFQWIRRKQIPQPEENFLFDHEDWRPGVTLTIQEHFWTEDNQEEMEKYHQPKVAICHFILENLNKSHAAFARSISFSQALDLLNQFAVQSYKDGRKEGFSDGYDRGHAIGYDSGNNAGYDRGFHKGFDKGYDRGHDIGYHAGYDKGYDARANLGTQTHPK